MLPFEDIPDDTVDKKMSNKKKRILSIFLLRFLSPPTWRSCSSWPLSRGRSSSSSTPLTNWQARRFFPFFFSKSQLIFRMQTRCLGFRCGFLSTARWKQENNLFSGIFGNEIKSQIVVSCTYEEGKPALMQVLENSHSRFQKYFQDLNFLRQMVEDDNQFLEAEQANQLK